ncbi:hypothetical protein DMC30DRAFT_355566 [Rhodotorula diobovata]|uniref:SH3 domain-containing protein n=1 Tax=Rhodotorula diobovata TaxID=5288 RepID=A0A5C5FPX4_9BASI|nr:hypothetical protein DMC30DRAFT_355566 [Rhodotorula diobovata]
MPSNPLPVHLPGECRKAQKILDSFANPVNGLDNVVPASVLRKAKGFCLLSVAKAGFLFSGRAGTGVVIARLEDGTWSAPSAVGTAGAGFGLQVGVELAEFLIILNSRAAVKSFMAAGSLTLGGNMAIAAGPLGRNVEGTGALSAKGGVAAMYSYSRTKGLFGGASVEGSVIVERSDANSKAYGQNVTAKQLLAGAVEPPSWALPLIETISRLATPARSLPGGGWSTDSPLESPALSTPGGASDIAADEEGYFSRARAQRRIEEQQEQGLTPREYKERGYAFGSSYAAGGSSSSVGFTPSDKGGRFGAMLGSVGRSRSGSGSGSGGGSGVASAQMSKKSSLGPGAGTGGSSPYVADAVEDPFAGGSIVAASSGPGDSATRFFETQFADEFDFDSARERSSPRPTDLMAFDAADEDDAAPPMTRATSSRKDGPLASPDLKGRSRASSSASATASNGGGGGGSTSSWFSRSTSRPKLTKNRSSSNAAATAGLRERAGSMRWDAQPGRYGNGDGDGDEDRPRYKAKAKEDAFGFGTRPRGSTFAPAAATAAGAGRLRSGTGGSQGALDLRPVEADFERVLSLSKHGGDGEVGAASGIGAPSPAGGRSRSGTGGGIGTAVALFDFPGVEPTDLPFKKGEVITILARDDEEWWKGRLRLREGMIPRNYVEAHFT